MTKHTIIAAIEKGELRASRTPGGHNRIRREDALVFMQQHNLLPTKTPSILILDQDDFVGEILRQVVDVSLAHFHVACDAYQAGVWMERMKPDVVVVDLAFCSFSLVSFLEHIRDENYAVQPHLILIGTAAEREQVNAILPLDEASWCEFLQKPFSVMRLKDSVKVLLENA